PPISAMMSEPFWAAMVSAGDATGVRAYSPVGRVALVHDLVDAFDQTLEMDRPVLPGVQLLRVAIQRIVHELDQTARVEGLREEVVRVCLAVFGRALRVVVTGHDDD